MGDSLPLAEPQEGTIRYAPLQLPPAACPPPPAPCPGSPAGGAVQWEVGVLPGPHADPGVCACGWVWGGMHLPAWGVGLKACWGMGVCARGPAPQRCMLAHALVECAGMQHTKDDLSRTWGMYAGHAICGHSMAGIIHLARKHGHCRQEPVHTQRSPPQTCEGKPSLLHAHLLGSTLAHPHAIWLCNVCTAQIISRPSSWMTPSTPSPTPSTTAATALV